MKKAILKIYTTAIFVIATMSAIAQDSTLYGRRDVSETGLRDLAYARIDSAADFQNFKKSAEFNVTNNKTVIDRLKGFKTKGDNESRAKYRNQVSALEDSNEEMAIRIAMADRVTTGNWASFKRRYNKDMLELTTSLKNISGYYFIN